MVSEGIPVRIDARHAIAHNKIIIIDGETVITGSFNFTRSAEESNAENLLIIRDKLLAEKYTANWNKHAGHSKMYEGRQKEDAKARLSEKKQLASKAGWESYEGFVGSMAALIFHKPGCKEARDIARCDFLRYSSREQALRMKVRISDFAVIDLDAPVLPAYEAVLDGSTYWVLWCKHCRVWHRHGPAEGHREAHCQDSSSPHCKGGYNLAYAGKWRKDGPKQN